MEQGSLYHILDVGPWESTDILADRVSEELTRWEAHQRDQDVRRQQYAAYRLNLVREAAQVLLTPALREEYDARPDVFTPPLVIPASTARVVSPAMGRVIAVSTAPIGVFWPDLQIDKSPRLRQGEKYLQHVDGFSGYHWIPWAGAPAEWACETETPQSTRFYFTDARIICVAPDFVEPEKGPDVTVDSFASAVLDIAWQSRSAAKARRAASGKALASQIPWEYLFQVTVSPGQDVGLTGGILEFSISAGEGSYEVACLLEGAPLGWLRAQAEWCVRVAMNHRLALFEDLLPNERIALIQASETPQPHIDGGRLHYSLPMALDACDALNLGPSWVSG